MDTARKSPDIMNEEKYLRNLIEFTKTPQGKQFLYDFLFANPQGNPKDTLWTMHPTSFLKHYGLSFARIVLLSLIFSNFEVLSANFIEVIWDILPTDDFDGDFRFDILELGEIKAFFTSIFGFEEASQIDNSIFEKIEIENSIFLDQDTSNFVFGDNSMFNEVRVFSTDNPIDNFPCI